jgi:predicted nucleic acid-binding protein
MVLADSSVWSWARRRPDIAEKLAERVERGDVATCAPVVLEAMHRAQTVAEYERLYATIFEPLQWLPLTEAGSRRAVDVQRQLASGTHGNHLRPAADFLIAACAEEAGEDVVLWFLDRDLRIICEHTGQRFEEEPTA